MAQFEQAAEFQSTLPIREETAMCDGKGAAWTISIHSSHTGRDILHLCKIVKQKLFQSTLPIREETRQQTAENSKLLFQSTLPIREETKAKKQEIVDREISIHSSHTGRDRFHFVLRVADEKFQSTLPIREETTAA